MPSLSNPVQQHILANPPTKDRSADDRATQAGVKDVITLFHAPQVPASTRVYTLLKQASATSQAHATEDQASGHDKQSKLERTDFELGMFGKKRGARR